MSSSTESSYEDSSYEYEFNPYDSDTFPDEQFILEDESQMFHRDQLHEEHSYQDNITVPPVDIPDDAIAICHSLDQSKQLIQKCFGVSPTALRHHPVPGIVIIPLKDINLIRKDNRHNRILPHIMVFPAGENFELVHSDFAQAIQILNQ